MTSLVYPKTQTAVVETVIYKIKPDHSDDFEEVLSIARSTIEKFPGFIEYKALRSISRDLLFIDLVKWNSIDLARKAELESFIAVFDEILIMDHFEPFTDDITRHIRKLDLFRADPNYYQASQEPHIIELKPLKYLSIKGIGTPENMNFKNAVEAIYSISYNLKFTSKSIGKDFVVAKMEGQWWVESGAPIAEAPPEEWQWNILIRMPEFISTNKVDKAVEEVIHKNNISLANEVQLITLNESRSVQIMHTGSYNDEKSTIDRLMKFIREHSLKVNGYHHEIFVSDPRNTPIEKLKTIIRYPVKQAVN
ncbi:GyrI-like domain-containing protein [Fulvivirga sp. 29W222]|uniref:GyrI-like domain-containing protein n=1 Tax=Fulvivirga marina TaxID=2494733 RepID=A0A937KEH2_9BACT|nr:GyrI-like domain-containing protein [Fulvivirga marina]MBL6449762.1 GyrI-like domain-containing protein [Fulvivirga marina]